MDVKNGWQYTLGNRAQPGQRRRDCDTDDSVRGDGVVASVAAVVRGRRTGMQPGATMVACGRGGQVTVLERKGRDSGNGGEQVGLGRTFADGPCD